MKRPVMSAMALGLVLSACGDSSGPAPFDADGTYQDLEAMLNLEFDSPEMESFEVAADVIGDVAMDVSIHAAPVSGARKATPAFARQLVSFAEAGVGLRPNFAFADYAGSTFEYDVTEEAYIETERTGAPSNGVRVILYTVDDGGNVVTPLQEIGYAQLTRNDASNPKTARLTAVTNGQTFINLSVSRNDQPSVIRVAANGFVGRGDERVNLELNVDYRATLSGNLADVSYKMSYPTAGFSLSTKISQASEETVTVVAEMDGSNGNVRTSATQVEGAGSGTIRVNGELYATIMWSGSSTPTVAGIDGRILTEAEIQLFESTISAASAGPSRLFGVIALTGLLSGF